MKASTLVSLFLSLLIWTTAEAGSLKTTKDQRFAEFQYISQVKTAQNQDNCEFVLVERLGFDSPGGYANLVLSVVQDQGAGDTLVYELPLPHGISPVRYAQASRSDMKADGDTLTFVTMKTRNEQTMTLQQHKIVFERKNGELTGRATLTSGRPYQESANAGVKE